MDNQVVIAFLGVLAGWVIAQLILLFFMDEVFDFLDNVSNRVRKLFRLKH